MLGGTPEFLDAAAATEALSVLLPLNRAASTMMQMHRASPPPPPPSAPVSLPPVFLVHDVTGDAAKFAPLAAALGDVPCFGVQLRRSAPVDSMPRLAEHYLAAISAVVAAGPDGRRVQLGGYSLGARVACCMATLAMSHGLQVTRVICFEEGASSPRVQVGARPDAKLLLGGLGFVLDMADGAVVAEGQKRLARDAIPDVVHWLATLPLAKLSMAVRAVAAGSDWQRSATLTAALHLRLWFAQQAARGSLLDHQQLEPHNHALPSDILLLRVDSASRSDFLAQLAMLCGKEPAAAAAAAAAAAETPDYGLQAAFPRARVTTHTVPGAHGSIWAKEHVDQTLLPVAAGFLMSLAPPAQSHF